MKITALQQATADDRDAIVALVHAVVDHLNQNDIAQWDEVYPNESHVDEDLQNRQLYLAKAGGTLAGIITLNRDSDPEYATADWQYNGPDYRVVHRLCVSPALQGQGIGRQMMQLAEAMLKVSGVKSLRLDAFSQNPQALKLYQNLGYRITGTAHWRKGLFYLMEKNIAPI